MIRWRFLIIKANVGSAGKTGSSKLFNADKKITSNLSTGKIKGSAAYQLNLGVINFSFGFSDSSVTFGGNISAMGRLGLGPSVTLNSDILNSDISINGSENINGDSVTNTTSVGIKPAGIIVVGGAILLERFVPPSMMQPQFNTITPEFH